MSSVQFIYSTTLQSTSVTNIIFDDIPTSYQDLILSVSGWGTVNNRVQYLRYNGSNTGEYSVTRFLGYSGGINNSTYTNRNELMAAGNWSNVGSSVFVAHIMNYANTSTFKTTFTEWADNSEGVGIHIGLYRSAAAVTQLQVFVDTGLQTSGTTFTLLGVR